MTRSTSSSWGRLGARYSRKCPNCGEYIFPGDKIKRQGKKTWVHENCYMPPGLKKEVDRMDDEFRNITRR